MRGKKGGWLRGDATATSAEETVSTKYKAILKLKVSSPCPPKSNCSTTLDETHSQKKKKDGVSINEENNKHDRIHRVCQPQ